MEVRMLELFVLETCPYCRKVMDFFAENNIEYTKHDISVPKNLARLLELGGERQVPFLYEKDKGVKMYESDDIIAYVKENYVR